MKLSKSAQRARAIEQQMLAEGITGYTASLRLSPTENHVLEFNTIEEAIVGARQLNMRSAYGRRAIVYAINIHGVSVPIDYTA
ncbi:MAG: hypothetical protein ACH344_08730 [Yersinia sp. (in: enterobacteria)]